MENYKKKIRARVFFMAMYTVAVSVFNLVAHLLDLEYSLPTDFLMGMICGIDLVAVFIIAKYLTALKNEEKLKAMYIEENDERNKTIRLRSGYPIVPAFVFVMLLAAVVAGYFNLTVMITLIATAFFELVVCLVIKLICQKTV
ncbi:MAG: hypothetical protein IJL87_06115 [Clostridia bacterium]|nr:hypothetical protein [Clostridia bacterium]